MTEHPSTETTTLWLLEQLQFCLQHELNAALQVSPCGEWVIAGGQCCYLYRELPDCLPKAVASGSSRFRHRSLELDDPLLLQCLNDAKPLTDLIWLWLAELYRGRGLTAIDFWQGLEDYPGLLHYVTINNTSVDRVARIAEMDTTQAARFVAPLETRQSA